MEMTKSEQIRAGLKEASLSQIARTLKEQGISSLRGKVVWSRESLSASKILTILSK